MAERVRKHTNPVEMMVVTDPCLIRANEETGTSYGGCQKSIGRSMKDD